MHLEEGDYYACKPDGMTGKQMEAGEQIQAKQPFQHQSPEVLYR